MLDLSEWAKVIFSALVMGLLAWMVIRARMRAYEQGFEDGYREGFDDGWRGARKKETG
jgi:hypothetical protein